jgi:hypothetical protein
LVEETGVPVENHWSAGSQRLPSSYNVVSSKPHLGGIWTHNFSGDRYWLRR